MEHPELEWRSVPMGLDEAVVRGGDDDHGGADLGERVRIGGPLAVPVRPEDVEGDLRTFVAAEAGRHTYHLTHVALSLICDRGDPKFESATLSLLLSATGGAAPEPVAWSMLPQRVTEEESVTTNFRFGPELTLEPVGLSLGSVERSGTRTSARLAVEARGLLRSDPSWRLTDTPRNPIAGIHRLVLVVRGAAGAVPQAVVGVRATVRERRVLRYRSRDLPPVVIAGSL